MKLRLATSQFPVTANVGHNTARILRHVALAQQGDADGVLFPEGALSGYVGIDRPSLVDYPWEALHEASSRIAAAARRHRQWVICGTVRRAPTGRGKPFNSLVVIDPSGHVVEHYDKRLLAVSEGEHFTAGDRPVLVDLAGVQCGLLICHEWRYPALYRQYKALGAQVILHSWYDGGYDDVGWRREGAALSQVIPATVQGHAVCHHLWICGSNTSRRHSSFGGFFVRPDGQFVARQPRHRPGVLVQTLDTAVPIPDPSAHHRPRRD